MKRRTALAVGHLRDGSWGRPPSAGRWRRRHPRRAPRRRAPWDRGRARAWSPRGGARPCVLAFDIDRRQSRAGVPRWALFAEDVSFSYGALLAEIVALGATHVLLNRARSYQTDGASDDLRLHTRLSPTLALVAETIRLARRDRLEVRALPHRRASSAQRPGEWRGTLAPRDPAAWFHALRRRARRSGGARRDGERDPACRGQRAVDARRRGRPAALAPAHRTRARRVLGQARLLGELGPLPRRAAARPRRRGGRHGLLQSARGRRVHRRRDARSRVEARAARARGVARGPRARLRLRRRLGYRSRTGTTATPWDEVSPGTPDAEEQRRGFAAFRLVPGPALPCSKASTSTAGTGNGVGGPATTGNTPRANPAEQEIRQLLQELTSSEARPLRHLRAGLSPL